MISKHILIIDDDHELCEELAESLEGEGYFVTCATDGARGEELIRDAAYDTVILDYKMPRLSGIDILKKLKSEKIMKKIFLVTGRPHVDKYLQEEGLSHMVYALMEKPINFNQLLEKVRAA